MVRPRQRPRDRVDRDSVTDPSPGWDHHTLARGPLCRSMIFLSSLSLKIVIDVGHPPPVILFLFCFCIGATLGGGIHLLPLLSFLSCPIGLGHCQTRGTKPSALCIVGWPRRFRQWQEADAVAAILVHQTRSSTLGSATSALPPSLDSMCTCRGRLRSGGDKSPPGGTM